MSNSLPFGSPPNFDDPLFDIPRGGRLFRGYKGRSYFGPVLGKETIERCGLTNFPPATATVPEVVLDDTKPLFGLSEPEGSALRLTGGSQSSSLGPYLSLGPVTPRQLTSGSSPRPLGKGDETDTDTSSSGDPESLLLKASKNMEEDELEDFDEQEWRQEGSEGDEARVPLYVGVNGELYDYLYEPIPKAVRTREDLDSNPKKFLEQQRNARTFEVSPFPVPELEYSSFFEWEQEVVLWKNRTQRQLRDLRLSSSSGRHIYRPKCGRSAVGGNDARNKGSTDQLLSTTPDPPILSSLPSSGPGSAGDMKYSSSPTRSFPSTGGGAFNPNDSEADSDSEMPTWDATLVPAEPNPIHYATYEEYAIAMTRWAVLIQKTTPKFAPAVKQLPSLLQISSHNLIPFQPSPRTTAPSRRMTLHERVATLAVNDFDDLEDEDEDEEDWDTDGTRTSSVPTGSSEDSPVSVGETDHDTNRRDPSPITMRSGNPYLFRQSRPSRRNLGAEKRKSHHISKLPLTLISTSSWWDSDTTTSPHSPGSPSSSRDGNSARGDAYSPSGAPTTVTSPSGPSSNGATPVGTPLGGPIVTRPYPHSNSNPSSTVASPRWFHQGHALWRILRPWSVRTPKWSGRRPTQPHASPLPGRPGLSTLTHPTQLEGASPRSTTATGTSFDALPPIIPLSARDSTPPQLLTPPLSARAQTHPETLLRRVVNKTSSTTALSPPAKMLIQDLLGELVDRQKQLYQERGRFGAVLPAMEEKFSPTPLPPMSSTPSSQSSSSSLSSASIPLVSNTAVPLINYKALMSASASTKKALADSHRSGLWKYHPSRSACLDVPYLHLSPLGPRHLASHQTSPVNLPTLQSWVEALTSRPRESSRTTAANSFIFNAILEAIGNVTLDQIVGSPTHTLSLLDVPSFVSLLATDFMTSTSSSVSTSASSPSKGSEESKKSPRRTSLISIFAAWMFPTVRRSKNREQLQPTSPRDGSTFSETNSKHTIRSNKTMRLRHLQMVLRVSQDIQNPQILFKLSFLLYLSIANRPKQAAEIYAIMMELLASHHQKIPGPEEDAHSFMAHHHHPTTEQNSAEERDSDEEIPVVRIRSMSSSSTLSSDAVSVISGSDSSSRLASSSASSITATTHSSSFAREPPLAEAFESAITSSIFLLNYGRVSPVDFYRWQKSLLPGFRSGSTSELSPSGSVSRSTGDAGSDSTTSWDIKDVATRLACSIDRAYQLQLLARFVSEALIPSSSVSKVTSPTSSFSAAMNAHSKTTSSLPFPFTVNENPVIFIRRIYELWRVEASHCVSVLTKNLHEDIGDDVDDSSEDSDDRGMPNLPSEAASLMRFLLSRTGLGSRSKLVSSLSHFVLSWLLHFDDHLLFWKDACQLDSLKDEKSSFSSGRGTISPASTRISPTVSPTITIVSTDTSFDGDSTTQTSHHETDFDEKLLSSTASSARGSNRISTFSSPHHLSTDSYGSQIRMALQRPGAKFVELLNHALKSKLIHVRSSAAELIEVCLFHDAYQSNVPAASKGSPFLLQPQPWIHLWLTRLGGLAILDGLTYGLTSRTSIPGYTSSSNGAGGNTGSSAQLGLTSPRGSNGISSARGSGSFIGTPISSSSAPSSLGDRESVLMSSGLSSTNSPGPFELNTGAILGLGNNPAAGSGPFVGNTIGLLHRLNASNTIPSVSSQVWHTIFWKVCGPALALTELMTTPNQFVGGKTQLSSCVHWMRPHVPADYSHAILDHVLYGPEKPEGTAFILGATTNPTQVRWTWDGAQGVPGVAPPPLLMQASAQLGIGLSLLTTSSTLLPPTLQVPTPGGGHSNSSSSSSPSSLGHSPLSTSPNLDPAQTASTLDQAMMNDSALVALRDAKLFHRTLGRLLKAEPNPQSTLLASTLVLVANSLRKHSLFVPKIISSVSGEYSAKIEGVPLSVDHILRLLVYVTTPVSHSTSWSGPSSNGPQSSQQSGGGGNASSSTSSAQQQQQQQQQQQPLQGLFQFQQLQQQMQHPLWSQMPVQHHVGGWAMGETPSFFQSRTASIRLLQLILTSTPILNWLTTAVHVPLTMPGNSLWPKLGTKPDALALGIASTPSFAGRRRKAAGHGAPPPPFLGASAGSFAATPGTSPAGSLSNLGIVEPLSTPGSFTDSLGSSYAYDPSVGGAAGGGFHAVGHNNTTNKAFALDLDHLQHAIGRTEPGTTPASLENSMTPLRSANSSAPTTPRLGQSGDGGAAHYNNSSTTATPAPSLPGSVVGSFDLGHDATASVLRSSSAHFPPRSGFGGASSLASSSSSITGSNSGAAATSTTATGTTTSVTSVVECGATIWLTIIEGLISVIRFGGDLSSAMAAGECLRAIVYSRPSILLDTFLKPLTAQVPSVFSSLLREKKDKKGQTAMETIDDLILQARQYNARQHASLSSGSSGSSSSSSVSNYTTPSSWLLCAAPSPNSQLGVVWAVPSLEASMPMLLKLHASLSVGQSQSATATLFTHLLDGLNASHPLTHVANCLYALNQLFSGPIVTTASSASVNANTTAQVQKAFKTFVSYFVNHHLFIKLHLVYKRLLEDECVKAILQPTTTPGIPVSLASSSSAIGGSSPAGLLGSNSSGSLSSSSSKLSASGLISKQHDSSTSSSTAAAGGDSSGADGIASSSAAANSTSSTGANSASSSSNSTDDSVYDKKAPTTPSSMKSSAAGFLSGIFGKKNNSSSSGGSGSPSSSGAQQSFSAPLSASQTLSSSSSEKGGSVPTGPSTPTSSAAAAASSSASLKASMSNSSPQLQLTRGVPMSTPSSGNALTSPLIVTVHSSPLSRHRPPSGDSGGMTPSSSGSNLAASSSNLLPSLSHLQLRTLASHCSPGAYIVCIQLACLYHTFSTSPACAKIMKSIKTNSEFMSALKAMSRFPSKSTSDLWPKDATSGKESRFSISKPSS